MCYDSTKTVILYYEIHGVSQVRMGRFANVMHKEPSSDIMNFHKTNPRVDQSNQHVLSVSLIVHVLKSYFPQIATETDIHYSLIFWLNKIVCVLYHFQQISSHRAYFSWATIELATTYTMR
jgi:hypothetical protein